MATLIDLTGQQFGRLLVKNRHGLDGRNTTWDCQCSCGGPKAASVIVQSYNLRHGKTVSCGCVRKEKTLVTATQHGMRNTKAYRTWIGMKDRCYNENSVAYCNYGGRGIIVDEHWKESFETFYTDMGDPPSAGHSIERRDVNGNYTLSNCYWGTDEEQANNKRTSKRLTMNGTTLTVTQWAKRIGIAPCSLVNRLDAGWNVERALTTPKRGRKSQ